jgi:hypothetical protein
MQTYDEEYYDKLDEEFSSGKFAGEWLPTDDKKILEGRIVAAVQLRRMHEQEAAKLKKEEDGMRQLLAVA